jgi:hypothetical protein
MADPVTSLVPGRGRRGWRVGVAIAFAGSAFACAATENVVLSEDRSDAVVAREIRVDDYEGHPRARMYVDDDGAARFELLSEGGARMVDLGASDARGSWFELADAEGRPRWRIACATDGSLVVVLLDGESRPRSRLAVGPDGEPEFEFLDAAGGVIRRLP